MDHLAPSLARLGLDGAAIDERTIRRAYARELKLIDQAGDPAGFQALREAYETVLLWAGARTALPATVSAPISIPMPAPMPAPAPLQPSEAEPEPESNPEPDGAPCDPRLSAAMEVPGASWVPDAALLAHQEMAALLAELQRTCAALAGAEPSAQIDGARDAFKTIVSRPLLLSFAAREQYERSLASLLAQGWRPGHDLMLEAALAECHWSRDRQHLLGLGAAGEVIARCIDELSLLDDCSVEQQLVRCMLVERMRRCEVPPAEDLPEWYAEAQGMCASFPTWLQIGVGDANVAAWLKLCREALPESPEANPFTAPPSFDIFLWLRWFFAMLAAMVIVRLLAELFVAIGDY